VIKEKLERLAQEKNLPIPTPLKTEQIESSRDYNQINKYAWEQDNNYIKIYMDLDGIGEVPKENVEVKFGVNSFEMKAHGVGGKNWRFSLSDLAKKIDGNNSTMKLRPKRVIFSLKKADSGNWDSLQYKEDKLKTPKLDAAADPTKGIMDMMKNMYESGDDDMKRTIAKAWTESRDKQGLQ